MTLLTSYALVDDIVNILSFGGWHC